MDPAQAEKVNDDIDNDLYKLTDNYKLLLKKCQINQSMGINEKFEVTTAATNIVFHCQHLLDIINELKIILLLQQEDEN